METTPDVSILRVLNVNVGILGHVDSGKTSLAKALSTQLSTAALDKNPQSVERGITLDLGFSALQLDMPEHLNELPYDKLQITFVDCPGHASLIRTIIGGAQIIDLMLLVIDSTKGIQTQTAECLVVGEISPTKDMIVVLNKIDLIPPQSRSQQLEKMKKRIRATLRNTKFANCSMVAVSANPTEDSAGGQDCMPPGMDDLVSELKLRIRGLKRSSMDEPFLFSVDHCFPIRGQGSVLTGTVLQGSVSLNQAIEIPSLRLQRKVKSMQMFHRPVSHATQGDRVGICVTQLDTKLLERGIAAAPGTVPTISGAIARVHRIRFFKGRIGGKTKFHVTVGHTTVMAEAHFFRHKPWLPPQEALPSVSGLSLDRDPSFDFSQEYEFQEELPEEEPDTTTSAVTVGSGSDSQPLYWAMLTFDSPVTCPAHSLLIASRLDTDIHSNTCRLAFHGTVASVIDPHDKDGLERLKVFKVKSRTGVVDRVVDSSALIARNMFKKDADISKFIGLRVITSAGDLGVIQSSFGKSGKFKVVFSSPLKDMDAIVKAGSNELTLNFKRYVFDKSKKIIQS